MAASISNLSGGSLTAAAGLTLLAWGVRWLHGELLSKKKRESKSARINKSPGRYHANLSPAALSLLVEQRAYPHIIFDVRQQSSTTHLPAELRGALRLPSPSEVTDLLGDGAKWEQRFQGIGHPPLHFMVIFVGDTEQEQIDASHAASVLGYQRTASLLGGISEFSKHSRVQAHVTYVSRDAVAVALGLNTIRTPIATLIDVRRHDERALYGAIKGSVHVPVEQLPSAMALSSDLFAKQYGFLQPTSTDLIILSCRTSVRSSWAAQIAADAGLKRVLVYNKGTFEWKLDPAVKVYNGYALLDPPPEPEAFKVEAANVEAGKIELLGLGIDVNNILNM